MSQAHADSTAESSPFDFVALAEPLGAPFDERLERFLAKLPGDIPNLVDGVRYGFGLDQPADSPAGRAARGKRIRPALCLLAARALGGDEELAYPFALGIELMHNFALIHDDIEDGDLSRRDRPAVWAKHGLAHGINIGDYCLAQVFRALAFEGDLPPALRLELIALMADALDHTIRGQALDINARAVGAAFAMPDYERIAREKTGHYLAAPLLGGAAAAGATREIRDALERYGCAVGPMFQIVDDAIDLTEGKGRGGARGSDIREGKRSFLVAWTLERAGAADRDRLVEILDAPRDATTAAMVDDAIALFERAGAMRAAQERADALRAEAELAVEPMPAELRGLLRGFAAYLSTRRN